MKVNVSHHPLIEDKMCRLRSIETNTELFRDLVRELTILIAYEATKDLLVVDSQVITPIMPTTGRVLQSKKIALIPILRAGLGMVDGFLDLVPTASVWHIGMKRNEETLQPEVYYNNVRDGESIDEAFLVDPMLATGGSNCAAIASLKAQGVKKITLMCLIAAPEGVEKINKVYPEIEIYAAMLDEKLNEQGYIVPGLGDAGDRLFGT